jgi:hypothetical protein
MFYVKQEIKILKISLVNLFFLLLLSCASKPEKTKLKIPNVDIKSNTTLFEMVDLNGPFDLNRQIKRDKSKLASKVIIYESGNQSVIVEKTVSMSRLGRIKINGKSAPSVRPEISQHEVWLNGQKFFSQLKLNAKKRSMDVTLRSNIEKWNGTQSYPFPQGQFFCFFSQIPECLIHFKLVTHASKSGKGAMSFTIIWDNYPYHSENFTGIGEVLFSSAIASFAGVNDGKYKFAVEFGQQTFFVQYDKDYKYDSMYWVSQGLSIKKR